MNFSFFVPPVIRFGRGCLKEVGKETARLGSRALLVVGQGFLRQSGLLEKILGLLSRAGVDVVLFEGVSSEPSVEVAEEAREFLRREKCDVVVGVGGGSVLDTAKTAAALAAAPGRVADYLGGGEVDSQPLPWIAVPTTAGTGSEATPAAVFSDHRRGIKTSIRGRGFMASVALVDPELTLSAPSHLTAYSGMDALTQALESLTSRLATPLTRPLSLQAAELIVHNLPRAMENGRDIAAREGLSLGSLMAGMALANARLGAVHGLAHPLGYRCKIPHGLACAALLVPVMEFNLSAAAKEYALLAERLGLSGREETEKARALVELVRQLNRRLGIPSRLRDLGLGPEDVPDLARQALASGSTKANPRAVTKEDLEGILYRAL